MNNFLSSFLSFILIIAIYAYGAYSVQLIAKKTNTPNSGFAWIPIVNIYLLLKIASKPGWWLILALIPLVNIVIFVIVWRVIAKAVNKPSWLGIMMLLPGVQFFVLGYLAFAKMPPELISPNS